MTRPPSLVSVPVRALAAALWLLFIACCALHPLLLVAADGDRTPLGRWVFWPDYRLERAASNYPGPRDPYPTTPFNLIDAETAPLLFAGQRPTERVSRLLAATRLPTRSFSAELWLVDHVNQPVGAIATVKGPTVLDQPAWVLGYYNHQVHFALRCEGRDDPLQLHTEATHGWKKYWHHVVATYDGSITRLYLNGQLRTEVKASGSGDIAFPQFPEFELAAYTANEPHMQLGNLVREVQLHGHALTPAEITSRFESLTQQIDAGIIDPHRFHFIAGPALSAVTRNSIGLMWETDRPATAIVRHGRQIPYDRELKVTQAEARHELNLTGLEADAAYFYEVTLTDANGTEISSGPLTFQTAVDPDQAFAFVVIGDTEARPHINDVLAKAVWGERPHFVVNVGDLTDGGQHPHKFQWNLEYFLGMNQLLGRIPMFPVPGNGESDLHWYTRYHVLPEPEHVYSFTFGNAEFFMLDSNRPMGPGSDQYAWLEKQLAASTARWKFAAHHHPTYSSDEDDYGNTWRGDSVDGDLKVRTVVPLYERYGVDIVFFGHLHSYERTWPIADGRVNQQRGVRYVQTGGGGGNLEEAGPVRNWFSAQHHRGHHYCLITIHENALNFRMFDIAGRLRDVFEIHKTVTP